METNSSFCFVDITPSVTTVTTSLVNEAQTWRVETPTRVAAAATSANGILSNADLAKAVDAHLSRVATAAHLATVDNVFFLTRHDTTQEVFALYVLRWLRAACPASTAVAAMPASLHATQVAGVSSALVIEGVGGLLTSTPILEGVVAAESAAHWGDVRDYVPAVAYTVQECWRGVAGAIMAALATTAQLSEQADKTSPAAGSTADMHATAHEHTWTDVLPFVREVQEHLQLCRRRELSACLKTVLLCGDVAMVMEARYCMGLLLSLFLPNSIVTWC